MAKMKNKEENSEFWKSFKSTKEDLTKLRWRMEGFDEKTAMNVFIV